jgi:hypothetical protein
MVKRASVRFIIICWFCLLTFHSYSQDSACIKVHFLYGSKPLKKYNNSERKWFGGILGGHVGIEGDSNLILNFLPSGKFHWFGKKNIRHSRFAIHDPTAFYSMFGTSPDDVKKTIVSIPVTAEQKNIFDTIAAAYLENTPYDYALVGMRCGSAAYEILGQLGILPGHGRNTTSMLILYPKKLRRRVLKKARENNWEIVRQSGSVQRKWEKD